MLKSNPTLVNAIRAVGGHLEDMSKGLFAVAPAGFVWSGSKRVNRFLVQSLASALKIASKGVIHAGA